MQNLTTSQVFQILNLNVIIIFNPIALRTAKTL